MAVLGVTDRRRQHVGDRHGAVVAQQHHPGLEGAGHAGREQAGAGHEIEAFAAIMRDGGAGRRHALAADHFRLAALDVMDDDRHIAARPVEMRLDHLQREGGGDAGVEGIAAAFQNPHADGGGDPMGRGHHAESAFDFRPRGEGVWIDVGHEMSLVGHGGTASGTVARRLDGA